MAMNVTEIVLKKPVTAHNEMLHVLELREPTYDEIEALGFPFIISGEGSIKLDSRVALKYIPLLAGIPRSSAAQMAKLDIFKTSMQILRFFTQSETGSTSGKRLYNVAWFWKLNPLELRRVAVSQFTELEAEAVRINEEMKHD
ncbi:bacteriophage protein [Shigella flexneri]|uniref:Bacteriophage protein n=1 Tax=Shigella flexneri TaxID=623 RepID=A0A658Z224_SHIFL|nr:bacteriophage protein [Shigella flexneri]